MLGKFSSAGWLWHNANISSQGNLPQPSYHKRNFFYRFVALCMTMFTNNVFLKMIKLMVSVTNANYLLNGVSFDYEN